MVTAAALYAEDMKVQVLPGALLQYWSLNSVGQSAPLITEESSVQVRQGPLIKGSKAASMQAGVVWSDARPKRGNCVKKTLLHVSYNGHYPSFPNLRREFDSRHMLLIWK